MPVPPAPGWVRWLLFALVEVLLFAVVYVAVNYVLSKITDDGTYALLVALISWATLSVLMYRLFFRTIGVFQLAHTQDLVSGELRRYGSGTNLLFPWETLTEDKVVDTEARVIIIPDLVVTAGDGSPFLASGQIRYHVDPRYSHRFIGVRKPDLDRSLIGIAQQIIREESARYATADELIKHFPDTVSANNTLTRGVIWTIEDRFMNGPRVTNIEESHGIEVDAVPVQLATAEETRKLMLDLFQDRRLAKGAEAILGGPEIRTTVEERLEATRLALLNDPASHLTHTVSEEKRTGEQQVVNRIEVDVSGTAGDTLKDVIAAGASIAQVVAIAKQQGGGQNKSKKGRE